MTRAEAKALREKWKQRGLSEPRPADLQGCEHPIQELVQSGLHDEGYLLDTYYCRACGEPVTKTL